MNRFLVACAIAGFSATPSLAQDVGDAAAGEEAFSQCQTCHVVENDEGEVLAGRNAKTGPNLYGVIGRQAGSVEGFRYGKDIVAAGEEHELVWDTESFIAYIQDPTGYLREVTDNRRARGKMAYKVRDEETAQNLYAYIKSLSPEGEGS